MSAQHQTHSKFAVFVGLIDEDGIYEPRLATEVERFAAAHITNRAIKSVGIEFLESSGKVVLSLGYREGEPGYLVRLQCKPLGRLGERLDPAEISAAMGAAAADAKNVICHEFYVTANGDFFLVMLCTA